jgi:phosphohistidine phosphatase
LRQQWGTLVHLYLVQHGEAVEKQADPERPLTPQGAAVVEQVAAWARDRVNPSEIWHSGKLRAQQTAERMSIHLGGKVVAHQGLQPNDAVPDTVQAIERREDDLMIVGHLPHLSRLASHLLMGVADREVVVFEKGGIVAIRRAQGTWQLRWMVVPDLLP